MSLILISILIISYFLPTIVARWRYHQNTLSITVLNVFLGWTVLGWIVALVWACTAQRGISTCK